MADDDEIDVLGEFSFNSCLAQNNQGIPSCSNREDTVHPQWLLDSTATNWYDREKHNVRVVSSPRQHTKSQNVPRTEETKWQRHEREILIREMAKYGRNIQKIANTLKTKTEAEIQMLIDSEYGVQLDAPCLGFIRSDDCLETPQVVQEEVVADDVITINSIPRSAVRNQTKSKSKSLLKPNILAEIKATDSILNSAEVFYEDDMIIGSTELVGDEESNISLETHTLNKKVMTKTRRKNIKNYTNHRLKKNKIDIFTEKAKQRGRDTIKSSPRRYKKNSISLENTNESPKMQIVLGSGKALPLSEGEKVIKIEKKKDSDSDSEVDIDIDSEDESNQSKRTNSVRSILESDYNSANDVPSTPENISKSDGIHSEFISMDVKENNSNQEPIAVPLRKFVPQPRRQKKINLDGGGGYTITHTESGDLYEYGAEPKRERQPKKQPVELMQCKFYNKDKLAPYTVELAISTLLCMDCHAHSSHGEVMGLVGGCNTQGDVSLSVYRPVAALSSTTHCDMDPVSQQLAASAIESLGMSVVCWHHSHPTFPATPSRQDVTSQRAMQLAFERNNMPMLAIITSQQHATGRTATHYRCFRVECCPITHEDVGYVLSVRLKQDVSLEDVPTLVHRLAGLLQCGTGELAIHVQTDVCPSAGSTYLEKCISSIRHHMRSAGYEDDSPVVTELIQSLTDIFR